MTHAPDSPDPIGDRLRAAAHHKAAGVRVDEGAALHAVRSRSVAARRRRASLVAGAAALAVVAVTLAVPRLGGDADRTVTDDGPAAPTTEPAPAPTTVPPTTTVTPSPTTTPGTPPATATPGPGGGSPTTTAGEPEPPVDTGPASFTRPPLWPFRTAAEVEEWQAAYAADGSEPWHLDAEETASLFTTQFLGFTEVDRVLGSTVDGDDAHVTVGYAVDPAGGELAASADIHLRRFGSGPQAPWEVVGTRDTDLTLTTPVYGSSATSPLTVGGEITGVDESLRAQVRQPSSPTPLGESCCEPAGGEGTPWRSTVTFSGATDPALTVVVSTGGHVQDVERFAITALRT